MAFSSLIPCVVHNNVAFTSVFETTSKTLSKAQKQSNLFTSGMDLTINVLKVKCILIL